MLRLELSVQEMRHQVVHALMLHHKEIEKMVNQRIQEMIDSGYMEQRIQQAVATHVDQQIDEGVRFALSRWSREAPTIKQAVEDAVFKALWGN